MIAEIGAFALTLALALSLAQAALSAFNQEMDPAKRGALWGKVQQAVYAAHGVHLEPEVRIVR